MARTVLIVGGGLAGLAAGCTLLARSNGALTVRVLERGHLFGGKASSVTQDDGSTAYDVDHGLHLFFDYPNLRALLADVAPDALTRLIPAVGGAWFFRQGQSPIHVRPWDLPSPLHLLAAWRVAVQAPTAIPGFARLFLSALLLRPERLTWHDRLRLDGLTFETFAESLGVPAAALQLEFARVAQRATFNFPFPTSALALLNVMRLVQQDYRAQVPSYLDGPCGDVIVAPLRGWLQANGAELVPYSPVQRIEHDATRVTGLRIGPRPPSPHANERASQFLSHYNSRVALPVDGGNAVEHADFYVSAVPAPVFNGFFDANDALRANLYFADLSLLRGNTTVACQLYYDRIVSTKAQRDLVVALPPPFSSVLDRAQIWRNPDNHDGSGHAASVLQFVGEDQPWLSNDGLLAAARALAATVYPATAALAPRRAWLHRAGHDPYFITDPGSDVRRPPSCSPLENLYVAGDYTAHSFGAVTMEGAVVSGIEAANQILRRIGASPRPVRAATEPGGAIPLIRALLKATGMFRVFTGYGETV
jgi:uncharacterized protein with NAD-binding domain and iron-sulfur cluster